jgi:hypothetical protein
MKLKKKSIIKESTKKTRNKKKNQIEKYNIL